MLQREDLKILLLAAGVFVVCLLFSLFPDDWLERLDNAGIVLGYTLSSLIVAAYFSRKWLLADLLRPRFYKAGEEFPVKPDLVDALLIPVSRREQPEWLIRHLKPRYCALLCTAQSRGVALQLVQDFGETVHFLHGAEKIRAGHDMISNPDDPLQSKEIGKRCIQHFLADNLSPKRIFVDTTGGKVPMSIGLFQAAEENGVSSIYVVGTQDGLIKDPREPSHGSPVFMSDRTGG